MYLLRKGTIPVTIYTGEHQVCPQQAGQSPRASTAEQGNTNNTTSERETTSPQPYTENYTEN